MVDARGGGRATLGMRFGGVVLDTFLVACTLYIGWLIWFALVARKGQSPAKQLLRMVVHDHKSGEVASQGQLWLRDAICQNVGPAALCMFIVFVVMDLPSEAGQAGSILYFWVFLPIFYLVALPFVLLSKDRRAPWDFLAGTVVRSHRPGANEERSDPKHVVRRHEADVSSRPESPGRQSEGGMSQSLEHKTTDRPGYWEGQAYRNVLTGHSPDLFISSALGFAGQFGLLVKMTLASLWPGGSRLRATDRKPRTPRIQDETTTQAWARFELKRKDEGSAPASRQQESQEHLPDEADDAPAIDAPRHRYRRRSGQ